MTIGDEGARGWRRPTAGPEAIGGPADEDEDESREAVEGSGDDLVHGNEQCRRREGNGQRAA
jgi:hypothetical protein